MSLLRRAARRLGLDRARGVKGHVTRQQVIWMYRLMLEREPESEAVIAEKIRAWTTITDLRWDFMASQEFRGRNPKAIVRPDRSELVIKLLPNGARLFVDLYDRVIGQAILLDEYEPDQLAFVRRTLGPGQVFVDVGAHGGRYTIECAGIVGPAGRVYAFEPHAANAALLRQSVEESRFEDRLTLEERAVGDGSRVVTLAYVEDGFNSGGAHLAERIPVNPNHDTASVAMVALDDYPFDRSVTLLKVDVEGAEGLVLQGAGRLLARDRPTVLMELHPGLVDRISGCSAQAVLAEARAVGYRAHALGSEGELRPEPIQVGNEPLPVVLLPPAS